MHPNPPPSKSSLYYSKSMPNAIKVHHYIYNNAFEHKNFGLKINLINTKLHIIMFLPIIDFILI